MIRSREPVILACAFCVVVCMVGSSEAYAQKSTRVEQIKIGWPGYPSARPGQTVKINAGLAQWLGARWEPLSGPVKLYRRSGKTWIHVATVNATGRLGGGWDWAYASATFSFRVPSDAGTNIDLRFEYPGGSGYKPALGYGQVLVSRGF